MLGVVVPLGLGAAFVLCTNPGPRTGDCMLPRPDARQRLRLRRFRMALAAYVMWVALAIFAWQTGQLELPRALLAAALAGIVLTNLYFYAMIRTGLNRRLSDPSMTRQQLVIALCWAMVLMLSTPEVRGVMMMVYAVTLLFGIFQLTRRGFFAITVFAIAGYLGVVALEYALFPDRFEPDRELLRTMVLGASLLWCAWFGSYVSQLKASLRQHNVELREAVTSASRMATRDHLTQSFNRRYMMECLGKEKARADRLGTGFSVCIFDLDHFKKLNDRHGHMVGDRVLAAFAYLARQELRASDVIDLEGEGRCFGRFGGEEFICLLPSTDEDGGRRCAERLRKATAETAFEEDVTITLSAGVAEYRVGEAVAETLRRADDALYYAKQAGRDQVACSTDLVGGGEPDDHGGDVVVVGKFKRSKPGG